MKERFCIEYRSFGRPVEGEQSKNGRGLLALSRFFYSRMEESP